MNLFRLLAGCFRPMLRQAMTCLFMATLASGLGAPPAHARRVALVIGIEKYTHVTPLINPEKDARRIAEALSRAQFAVTLLVQPAGLTRAALVNSLKLFRSQADGAEAAVIYFAGHGVEVEGRNWVLPIDVEADRPGDLQDNAIPVRRLLDSVTGAERVRLVVLDACRDNPFALSSGWSTGGRSIGTRGLAREVSPDEASVLLLSAQPGQKAADGIGQGNSPFANLFARAVEMEGLRISSLPTQLLNGMRSLGINQAPDLQGIFADADWSFRSGNFTPALAPAPVPAAAPATVPVEGFGLSLRQNADSSVIVAHVAHDSAYVGKLQPGDIITRVNGAGPTGPAALISTIQQEGQAELLVSRNGQSIFTILDRPKESE